MLSIVFKQHHCQRDYTIAQEVYSSQVYHLWEPLLICLDRIRAGYAVRYIGL